MKDHRYEIIIYWSKDDQAYIAEAPELPGCLAHGDNYQEALDSIQDAIDLWLETAQDIGRPIPEPKEEKLMYA
jgi:predicted RNase H-like HicB family nuclease